MHVRIANPIMYQIPEFDGDRRLYRTRRVIASMLWTEWDSRAADIYCKAVMKKFSGAV